MLKYGAVTVDFTKGLVYGDIEHCPLGDLLESAQELIRIAPKGTRAVGKAYDSDSYLYGAKRLQFTELPKTAIPENGRKPYYLRLAPYFKPEWYDKVIAFLNGNELLPAPQLNIKF